MMAALIAGGCSTRMQRDKCLLTWQGVPLWRHQLETLAALQPATLAVAAPCQPSWLPSDVNWIPDWPESCGPLSGILAVLRACETGLLVVLAVDLPCMTADYLRTLLTPDDGRGAVPFSLHGYEPMAAVYPREAAEIAEARVQSRQWDLQGWVEELAQGGLVRKKEIRADETRLFHNCNYPEDLNIEF